jgi:SAM-dependent methyltransferase
VVVNETAALTRDHTAAWPEFVCPNDGHPLTAAPDRLRCHDGHVWPIELGLLRMVDRSNYAGAFGLQWKSFPRTQLDSYTRTTLSRDRARRCLGEDCWTMLHRRERVDVLEVGCGAGRFTEILLSTNACVTSVDLSAAVEANQDNFPQGSRHRIVQADVRQLPFAPGQYDLVFCLGVVQHTPHPETTIERLYSQVKPGGFLVIDHYTPTLSHFTKSAVLVRLVLCRMSPDRALRVVTWLVDRLLPLHRMARRSRVAQACLSRISPVLSYYHVLPLGDELQKQWALLDTYDSLTDYYKHFRTRGQLVRLLRHLGAVDVWSEYGGNGVEARARRA